MDLILHKRILALQEENALLRKNLQELSDELKDRWRTKARKQIRDIADRQYHNDHWEYEHKGLANWPPEVSQQHDDAEKMRRRSTALKRDAISRGAPIKTLRTKDEHGVHQTLHKHNGKHYVVSSNQNETLIFPSDEHGDMPRMIEVHHGEDPKWNGDYFDPDYHHAKAFREFMEKEKNKKQSD